MVMRIDVRADFGPLLRKLDGLGNDIRNTVIARTLNRIGDQTRTQATREITAEFNIKASTVRDRIVVRRALARSRLAVTIEVPARNGKRAINVMAFGARQLKAGLRFKVKRAGAPITVPTGFIGNKGKTAFTRERRKGQAKRLPIYAVSAVDVPQMFNTTRISNRLLANIRQRFPIEFDRQLKFALTKFNR